MYFQIDQLCIKLQGQIVRSSLHDAGLTLKSRDKISLCNDQVHGQNANFVVKGSRENIFSIMCFVVPHDSETFMESFVY